MQGIQSLCGNPKLVKHMVRRVYISRYKWQQLLIFSSIQAIYAKICGVVLAQRLATNNFAPANTLLALRLLVVLYSAAPALSRTRMEHICIRAQFHFPGPALVALLVPILVLLLRVGGGVQSAAIQVVTHLAGQDGATFKQVKSGAHNN